MARTPIKTWLALLVLLVCQQARAITVFACEPEWGALTRALLPEAVVRTATSHLQDPHHIEARPSLIAQLRGADFAICTGADLEAGWLPTLQDKAGNPRVLNGQPGMFYAAQHVPLIDPHKGAVTPFSGDVHAHGNPHVHADPHRLLAVARALGVRLATVFPAKKVAVEQNLRRFELEMTERIAGWEQRASKLRGRSVMTQHASFGYLWPWLGLTPVADLEPKPGLPPTPAHLERFVALGKVHAPVIIVIAQHQDPKPARWLASKLGAQGKLLILPATVTDDQPGAIFQWLDAVVAQLTLAAD